MSEMSTSIKEIIDRLWEQGRESGLSDKEIIDMIEEAMKERIRTQGRTPRKKYDYKPMTDEEIRAAQEKIEETPIATKTIRRPQILYGPPPVREKVVEVRETPQVLYGPAPRVERIEVNMPQVLYGPPPREEVIVEEPQVLYGPPQDYEVYEMFEDEPEDGKGEPPKVR